MKKLVLVLGVAMLSTITFAQEKLVTKIGHAKFYSHTDVEDIEAHNYKVISSINPATGDIVFSVPMQSFEFEKSAMQKHFNSAKFLDTQEYPKAKFKGKIVDLSKVDFSKDGTYTVEVTGELSIHGETKTVTENGTITIKDGKISASSSFPIALADYKIAFEKGKPSTNIAKDVKVTVELTY